MEGFYSYVSNHSNMTVNELNAENNKTVQPKGINITLKPHQLTALYKMKDMEQTKEITIMKNDTKYLLDTNIGILGDQVGFGKTITALSLLEHNDIKKINKKYLNNTSNTLLAYEVNNTKYLDINIIIVPHNIFFQWKNTIESKSKYNFFYVQKNSDLEELKLNYSHPENVFISDIKNILVSSTRYKKFHNLFFENLSNNFEINRLIIDEADSINIPNMPRLKSSFTWFITATFEKLTYCKNYGFIRYLFDALDTKSFNMMVVKNKKEYVESSFQLIDYDTKIHNCFSLYYNLNKFTGLVSSQFIEMVNAGDMSSAVEYLGFSSDTETDLISLLTNGIEKKISNKLKKKKYIYDLDISENEKNNQIQIVDKEIEKLNNQLSGIKERIENLNEKTCSICMDNYQEPSSLPCTHVFCAFCLVNHIKFSKGKPKCPTCRVSFNPSSVVQIKDKIEESKKEPTPEKLDKHQVLINLIKKKSEDKKFVIFSNFNNSFNKVLDYLNKNKISYSQIKGSAVESIVNRFNKGENQVLFLNSNYCGAGIDLSSATDLVIYHCLNKSLEKQVIGRAQRIGRTKKLTVHKLLYDGESQHQFI
jgi:SNF2 family DNA or RNA helicase